ncbi:hypothetical protein ACH5RR_015014 [Cinchona calisaya]|uniref:At1g61320/AtMIF1 LRR domain-containing protein n=1 Tax=Cinchona calisaya TaxID=153742 RepID=A0ABD2ZVE8_9GENT
MDEAVAAGILSKRWKYLWTNVPNMVYCHPLRNNTSFRGFAEFINETLAFHSCLKIKNFVVNFNYAAHCYEYFDLWVRFAVRNKAEELGLILLMDPGEDSPRWVKGSCNYILPSKLYSNSGLRKLELSLCGFAKNSAISWDSLKSLSLRYVRLDEYVMGKILTGSPKLEYLELNNFTGIKRLNITSASVKKLVLRDYYYYDDEYPDQNDTSSSYDDDEEDEENDWKTQLKISCPHVRALEILGSFGRTWCRLTDHPASLVEANLDFTLNTIDRLYSKFMAYVKCQIMVQGLLERLQNAEKRSLGTWVFKFRLYNH